MVLGGRSPALSRKAVDQTGELQKKEESDRHGSVVRRKTKPFEAIESTPLSVNVTQTRAGEERNKS